MTSSSSQAPHNEQSSISGTGSASLHSNSQFATELTKEWNQAINDFKHKEADYSKLETHLLKITREIRKTVGATFKTYLENCESAYQMLCSLKQAIQPTDTVRDLYLLKEWSKLSKTLKRTKFEHWFLKWVSVYRKCQLAGVLRDFTPSGHL